MPLRAAILFKYMPPDLSVVIPAWDERENLEVMLPGLQSVLKRIAVHAEILVIDGGSKDGTREAAERLGARVILQRERGYGGALLAGFAASRAPYVVTMDADLSHPPDFLQEFWRHRESAAMLIASRYVPGGRAEMSWFRKLLSLILNKTFAAVLKIPVKDLSSGFRMYRRTVLDGLTLESRDFDVLQELLVKIHARGWEIREIPLHYMPRGAGRSHARMLRFGVAYAKLLLRLKQNYR